MLRNDYLAVFDPQSSGNVRTELPQNAARSDLESSLSSREGLRKNRILCVDDEIICTAIRAEVLRENGYSVVVYHSPFAVLDCDLSSFDLAVLDFQMPGLNGRELFLRMRASGATFPIVLLTGSLDALSPDSRVLFARCIDKATSIHCLLSVIAEFLDPNPVPDYASEGPKCVRAH